MNIPRRSHYLGKEHWISLFTWMRNKTECWTEFLLNPTIGREAYKLSWAQVMIRRKEKFLFGGNVRWLKKNNRERNNAFADITLRSVKRKLYMKEKPSLKGRVEGWETTEIKQGGCERNKGTRLKRVFLNSVFRGIKSA